MKNGERVNLRFSDLSQANRQRDAQKYNHLDKWSPERYACALGGEVGECLNKIKKLFRLEDGEDKPWNAGLDADLLKQDIADEIADIVTYADLLAQRLGISLAECVARKFNEISNKIGSDVKL